MLMTGRSIQHLFIVFISDNMTAVQPVQTNEVIKGFALNEKVQLQSSFNNISENRVIVCKDLKALNFTTFFLYPLR